MDANRKIRFPSSFVAIALYVTFSLLSIHGMAAQADNVSQQELSQDEILLKQVSKTRDVGKFDALATLLQKKWLDRDTSSYLLITSNICEDLSNYDFGLNNIKTVQQLDQKFAATALANAKHIPLGQRAFLTIQVAQPAQSANDKDWPRRRNIYAVQILSIWQELQQQANQPAGNEPMLPSIPKKYLNPKMYPNGIVLLTGSRVDPAYITDAAVRSSYQSALEKYDSYFDVLQEKQDALNSLRWYKLVAPANLALMYATGPDGTEELTLLLRSYGIPSQDQSNVLHLLNSQLSTSPIT